MGCGASASSAPPPLPFRPKSKPCQSGYLLYSDGNQKWKKVFVILFKDTTMAWFKQPKQKQPINHVMLKDVCSRLLVGPVCKKIPSCPRAIPNKTSYSYMIAFPQWNSANSPTFFFLCPSGSTMGTWMTSLATCLPPPKQAGLAPNQPGYDAVYPPVQGQYPPQGQQTVIVQQHHQAPNHCSGGGGFSKGFLAGASLGYGFNQPWSYGWDYGYGYHPSYGWGYEDYDSDCDVDIDIDVHYHFGSCESFGGSDFVDYDHGGDHDDYGYDFDVDVDVHEDHDYHDDHGMHDDHEMHEMHDIHEEHEPHDDFEHHDDGGGEALVLCDETEDYSEGDEEFNSFDGGSNGGYAGGADAWTGGSNGGYAGGALNDNFGNYGGGEDCGGGGEDCGGGDDGGYGGGEDCGGGGEDYGGGEDLGGGEDCGGGDDGGYGGGEDCGGGGDDYGGGEDYGGDDCGGDDY